MLYVDCDTDAWAKKHGIDIEEMECASCKKIFKTTVPIVMKGYAGLEMPEHGCDRKFLGAIFTPTSKGKIEAWNKIIQPQHQR